MAAFGGSVSTHTSLLGAAALAPLRFSFACFFASLRASLFLSICLPISPTRSSLPTFFTPRAADFCSRSAEYEPSHSAKLQPIAR